MIDAIVSEAVRLFNVYLHAPVRVCECVPPPCTCGGLMSCADAENRTFYSHLTQIQSKQLAQSRQKMINDAWSLTHSSSSNSSTQHISYNLFNKALIKIDCVKMQYILRCRFPKNMREPARRAGQSAVKMRLPKIFQHRIEMVVICLSLVLL